MRCFFLCGDLLDSLKLHIVVEPRVELTGLGRGESGVFRMLPGKDADSNGSRLGEI